MAGSAVLPLDIGRSQTPQQRFPATNARACTTRWSPIEGQMGDNSGRIAAHRIRTLDGSRYLGTCVRRSHGRRVPWLDSSSGRAPAAGVQGGASGQKLREIQVVPATASPGTRASAPVRTGDLEVDIMPASGLTYSTYSMRICMYVRMYVHTYSPT
jgi:hypothetical protein